MVGIQKKIYGFTRSLEFDPRVDDLHFEYSKPLTEYLNQEKIEFERIREEEINIPYANLGFQVFKTPSDFLTISNIQKVSDILILDYISKPLSRISNETYFDFQLKNELYFFTNAKAYLSFIDFLKSQDQETEDSFHFVDYFNDVNRTIVLTSLAEKSRLILKYFKGIPDFPSETDYSRSLRLFKNCFSEQNQNLQKFLKSSVIKYASRYEQDKRMELLFQNVQSVVEDAKMNFEIYINNLSIDKIRKDYDEYKSKYFSDVSEILKKVTQQIIGFPIVLATSLFAIEKVKENQEFLWLLAVAIFVTTIYLILLLKMNFRDLEYIDKLSRKDFDTIKNNNFFVRFPDQFQTFQEIKNRITIRISNLSVIAESYFWILSLSNTAMIVIILCYQAVPTWGIVISAILITLGMSLARNRIWDERAVHNNS